MLLNHFGLIVDWDCDTANVHDGSCFRHLIEQVGHQMVVSADKEFAKVEGTPANLRVCQRGEWNCRLLVETVLLMLTRVCHLKKVAHRCWAYFKARLAFTMAAFNLLVQWDGLPIDNDGFVPLSIAHFSL